MMKYVTAKRMTYVVYLLLLLALGLSVMFWLTSPSPGAAVPDGSLRLTEWETDGGRGQASLPLRLPFGEPAAALSLSVPLPEHKAVRCSLIFFSDAPLVSAYLEDDLIYLFEATGTAADKWHVVNLPEHYAGKTLALFLGGSGGTLLTPVYMGGNGAVMNTIWLHHLPLLLSDFALFTCGVAMLLVSLLARRQWRQPRQHYWVEYAYLWHLGIFLMVFSVWILCRGEIVHLFFNRPDMIFFLEKLLYLLAPPIFLPHFRQLFVRDRRWMVDIVFLSLTAYFLAASLLSMFNVCTFSQVKTGMTALLIAAIAWIFWFFLFLRRMKEQEAWTERFVAFCILPFSFILQLMAGTLFDWIENDHKSVLLTIGLLVYCGFIASITAERAIRRINEIAETREQLLQSKMSLMLSQIRPHFIFNVLNSISTLCTKDAHLAQAVIKRFSDYLRHNINALGHKGNLPFEQELAFVESYVDLEKLRFGSRLEVVYDIQTTDFSLPLLSIQPIVENAIRHGICNKREGGIVWVKTYRDDNNCYVEVADNGVGFTYTSQQPKTHKSIALENISMRLKTLTGGSVEISERKNGGATVLVTVPANRKEATVL